MAMQMQNVQWLYVSTSESHSWGHFQSKISYERCSDPQRLRSYGYLKFNVEHEGRSCDLQHRKFSLKISLFCLLCIYTPRISCGPINVNGVGERFGDRSGHLCGPSRPNHRSWIFLFSYCIIVDWNVGAPKSRGVISGDRTG
jgi:hypothetical protein